MSDMLKIDDLDAAVGTAGASPDRAHAVQIFVDRMLRSLTTNNTLRGAWAEEVVGHFLGTGVVFPDQWSYCDLLWRDFTISVKHSVNQRANFNIQRKSLAFDTELAKKRQMPPHSIENPEGWRGHRSLVPQYWCDVYVFAWLPDMVSIESVTDFDAWRFVALSRGQMHHHFRESQKTIGVSSLKQHGLVPGTELAELILDRTSAATRQAFPAPPIDWRTFEQIRADLESGNNTGMRSAVE